MTLLNANPGRAAVLWTGVAGLLGAGLMFAGDQLFYGHWGSGAEPWAAALDTIRRHSPARLMLGGVLCVPAGVGYLLGLFHVHARLAPAPALARNTVTALLGTLFVLATATHAVWGGYALMVQRETVDQALGGAVAWLRMYLDLFGAVGQWIGVPASLGLLGLTLWGRTTWPRWAAILNPGLLYFGLATATWLPGPFGAAIVGGGFNLAFTLFFLMSVLTPPKPEAAA